MKYFFFNKYFCVEGIPVPLRLHSDNMTVVNCLNRLGSARSKPLNDWVVSILSTLRKKDLFLTTCHIAGVRNVIADGLSRSKPLSSEWTLDHQSFSWLCQKEFVPSVDLFATKENHKLRSYVSPVPDIEAVAVDAFSSSQSIGVVGNQSISSLRRRSS